MGKRTGSRGRRGKDRQQSAETYEFEQYTRGEQITTTLPTLSERRASYRKTGPKIIVLRTNRSTPWHVGQYGQVLFSSGLMMLNNCPSMLEIFEGDTKQ